MAKLTFIVLAALLSTALSIYPFPKYNSYLPWKIGFCKTGNVIDDKFVPEKFFTGKWYEKSSFGNFLIQGDGICTSMEAKITDDKITTLFYQYEPILKKYAFLRGETPRKELSDATFKVKFDFLGGLANVKLPLTIVDTDYDNFAVIYSCQQAFGLKAEMGWVITRQRGDNTKKSNIQKAMVKYGLNENDFVEQKSTGCGSDEPHL